MHTLDVHPFHLDHTLDSGQVFRWHKSGDVWEGVVNGRLICISQNGSIAFIGDEDFIRTYFRLDDDLDHILSTIDKDPFIHQAITTLYGLRLIRQDPWECLISFVCSSFNNVPRIKGMVENLCRAFGEKRENGYYTFPTPESLAEASLSELRKCGLGYRDVFVSETARIVSEGFNLSALKSLPYMEAKNVLLALPGVGHKVADCVLLFSLDKLEAFPCDVNIERCVTHFYGACGDVKTFGKTYFGAYAGYANHYLYHYHRRYMKR